MSLHRVSKRSVFVVCWRLCQCVMLFVGVCVSVLCCVLVSVSVCFVLCLNAMIVSVRNFSLWSTQGRTFLRHRKCGGMKWRFFHFRNAAMPQVHLTCWLCIFLRMSSRFRLTVLPTPPPPLKNKSYVSFVAFPAAVSLGHAPMRASPLALNRSRHFLNLVQTSGSSTDSIGFAQLWSQKSFDKQAPDFAFWVFFRWNMAVIFCWDISVICLTAVLKLAITVFISLDFQTFWPKWLNFFRSFQKHSGLWPEKKQLCNLQLVGTYRRPDLKTMLS